MPMEIHEDKIVMRAGKYNLPYVMTNDDIELLKWAVSTINSFTAPDRPNGAWKFVYTPKLADLRNLLQRIEAAIWEKQK